MFEKTQMQYLSNEMNQYSNLPVHRSKSPSIPVMRKGVRDDGSRSPRSIDELRSEQMYDWATWRMYNRITNARRQQYYYPQYVTASKTFEEENTGYQQQFLSSDQSRPSDRRSPCLSEHSSECTYYDYQNDFLHDDDDMDEIFVLEMES